MTSTTQRSARPRRFCFLQGRKMLIVDPAQIIRLEASSNYTYVYFTHHPPLLMAKVLRVYDRMLSPYGFIRTHRSHLVNELYVDQVDTNGIIRMKDDSTAEVSRRKKREIIKVLSQS